MEPGHTKFSPDQHFGSLKSAYISHDNIETFADCIDIAKQSSKKNIVVDLKDEKLQVYEWDNYLADIYDKCPSVLKIFEKHYYRFEHDEKRFFYRHKY